MQTRTVWPAPILLFLGSVLLIGLPLLGIRLAGVPIGRYLEFPPHTHYVEHSGFSWPVFAGLALLILLVTLPFIVRILFGNQAEDGQSVSPQRTQRAQIIQALLLRIIERCFLRSLRSLRLNHPGRLPVLLSPILLPFAARRFPAWGWVGLAFGIGAWILAWSRFEWFAPWQAFTFSPLWFSYIITINALTYRRTGQCLLTHQPRFFLLLFPVSAVFWWLFEYLNRFVQNWYYIGVGGLSPLEYFLFATLPFSTVLPAVLGTYRLLATYPRLSNGLTGFFSMPFTQSRFSALIILTLSATGLACIGLWPDYLFPLLWLAPLGVLASLKTLVGRTTIFADLVHGDWRRIVLLALAALICGIFWEMWNFYSAAKWVYAVPYVNRFHIFEMPVLGYAGYLPFGLECALIADLLCGRRKDEGTQ